ncbi:alpha/beta fold hydrolase [uncultured Microscilla sp.]|uniref:alpha/beta hydrolase family protein n=1 Tax=uncultured Microscilla sp. TaxID=432653 RepID=UPI00260DD796|nr:alpha/beta fold hydrolase [uncultured Microscilla sp.]
MNFKKIIIQFLFILLIFTACNSARNVRHSDKSPGNPTPSKLFHIPYVSPGTLNRPTMILVLHGDAPFNKPSYQYAIARKIAKENQNVVAVGVLRPGYTDSKGNRSEGERGEATGDNYTKEVLASIHHLATNLKKRYNPSKIVLVGHSGGAAISANLLAKYSSTYAAALLISCPCDVHRWRKHMKTLQDNAPIWDAKVNSLSPIEEIKHLDDDVKVIVVHGTNDKVVPISIANKYVKALQTNKKKVSFVALEGQGHEIAFNKKVFKLVKELIQ